MLKFDLQNVEDLALIGVLLSKDQYPTQGSNYITNDGKREHYAYYGDEVKELLKDVEDTPEYKAAYLMAVFVDEARKQVPLVVHKLPNNKEVMIPANMKKNEVLDLISKI
jgi:hypothetical protein